MYQRCPNVTERVIFFDYRYHSARPLIFHSRQRFFSWDIDQIFWYFGLPRIQSLFRRFVSNIIIFAIVQEIMKNILKKKN